MAKTKETDTKTKAPGKPGKGPGIDADRPENAVTSPGDEIDRLGTMTVGELQKLYAEVIGEMTRCPRRDFLVRKILEATVPVTAASETEAPEAESEAAAATAPSAGGPADNEQVGAAGQADATVDTTPATGGTAGPWAASSGPAAPSPKLSKLDIPALQELYREIIGRETRSTSRGYLVFKLQEAQKGRVPLGPRKSRREANDKVMVLPLRMEARLVERLDEAWPRLGHLNRMDLFRAALGTYLAGAGERELAELLGPNN